MPECVNRAPPPKTDSPSGSFARRLSLPDEVGAELGAWEVFQHRPILEVYAQHYGLEVCEFEGVRALVRRLPVLGSTRASVYGPEAAAGSDWSSRLSRLSVGELSVLTNAPASHGWGVNRTKNLASVVVDLRGDPDSLWSGFETRARTAVRKAAASGLVVQSGDAAQDLPAFYEVAMRKSGGGTLFEVIPMELTRALLVAGQGSLYLARYGSTLVGGCLVIRNRNAHVLLAVFDAQACNGLPSTTMYVHAMLQEQARGVAFFDLGPHILDDAGHANLIRAKLAFRPLLLPAYRYVQPGAGWRGTAYASSRWVRHHWRKACD